MVPKKSRQYEEFDEIPTWLDVFILTFRALGRNHIASTPLSGHRDTIFGLDLTSDDDGAPPDSQEIAPSSSVLSSPSPPPRVITMPTKPTRQFQKIYEDPSLNIEDDEAPSNSQATDTGPVQGPAQRPDAFPSGATVTSYDDRLPIDPEDAKRRPSKWKEAERLQLSCKRAVELISGRSSLVQYRYPGVGLRWLHREEMEWGDFGFEEDPRSQAVSPKFDILVLVDGVRYPAKWMQGSISHDTTYMRNNGLFLLGNLHLYGLKPAQFVDLLSLGIHKNPQQVPVQQCYVPGLCCEAGGGAEEDKKRGYSILSSFLYLSDGKIMIWSCLRCSRGANPKCTLRCWIIDTICDDPNCRPHAGRPPVDPETGLPPNVRPPSNEFKFAVHVVKSLDKHFEDKRWFSPLPRSGWFDKLPGEASPSPEPRPAPVTSEFPPDQELVIDELKTENEWYMAQGREWNDRYGGLAYAFVAALKKLDECGVDASTLGIDPDGSWPSVKEAVDAAKRHSGRTIPYPDWIVLGSDVGHSGTYQDDQEGKVSLQPEGTNEARKPSNP